MMKMVRANTGRVKKYAWMRADQWPDWLWMVLDVCFRKPKHSCLRFYAKNKGVFPKNQANRPFEPQR